MNLNTRKARVPIAALGVTALCTAGLGVAAGSAFAETAAGTTLSFTPAATSATIVNVDPATATGRPLAYGLKVAGINSDASPVYVSVLSGPTSGEVYWARAAGNNALNTAHATVTTAINFASYASGATSIVVDATAGAQVGDMVSVASSGGTQTAYITAVTNGTTLAITPLSGAVADNDVVSITAPVFAAASVPVGGVVSSTAMTNYVSGDNVFLGATDAGTYTLRFFQDQDGDGEFSSAVDSGTSTFTLNVKDVTAQTPSTTADDLDFGLTAPASGLNGDVITATATPTLSLIDTRGLASSKGVLGTALNSLMLVPITGTAGGIGVGGVTTFTGTSFTRASGTTSSAGTVIFQPKLAISAVPAYYLPTAQAVTTTIATNGVTGLTLAAPAVTGSVATDAVTATQTNVKNGTTAVDFTATVVNAGTPTDIANKVVTFTLGGTDVASLTTNGTLVSSGVFTATTNSSGVATLRVTDGATTPSGYTVAATSNAINGTTRTVVYGAAAGTSFLNTNTASELTPSVTSGVSVTLKGKLLDQFGAPFTPAASSSDQTVAVSAPAGVTTICNATIAAGLFSCAYTPATTPTAGGTTTFRYAYTGATTLNSTIQWATATAPASITLTTPLSTATGVNLSTSQTLVPGQTNGTYGNTTGEVTGVVKDAGGTALAYKSVTLTGTAGVYFSTLADGSDLLTSVTVVSDNLGVFDGAYAFFTKAGSATITATAGTAVKTATVTTDSSDDPYKVTVNDVSGKPGSTLIVTGTIKDAFGNVVPNEDADLSLGTSTLGAFGDNTPTTNSLGVFSTTFTSGSNSSGTATITATLDNMIINPTADEDWTDDAKITVPAGEYMDQATITLTDTPTTITATGSIIGGGTAQLSGTAEAGASVEVWAKASGDNSFSLVSNETADSEGAWGTSASIMKTTAFFAKSNNKPSSTVSTVVFSTQTMKAKALGKGKVQFKVYGTPNVKGWVNIYAGDVRLAHVRTNNNGDVTTLVQSKAGRRTFRVYFVAPGTSLKGSSLTGTVK